MSKLDFIPNSSGTGTITLTTSSASADRVVTAGDQTGNSIVSDGTLLTVDYASNRVTFGGTIDSVIDLVNESGVIVNSNTTLGSAYYFANTNSPVALTLTLPASANIGDVITVVDNVGKASSNNITIDRNSHNIDGAARNVIINTDFGGVSLVYESSRNGWLTEKIEKESVSGFQGEVSGYTSGGYSPGSFNTIDKFSFAVDTNATDVGDLTQARQQPAGQSSKVSGYSSGGFAPPDVNTIDKFPFAVDTDATDVGDLFQTRREASGQSSTVSGYTSGGYTTPATFRDTIDKFPFAADGNATDVGNLISGRSGTVGQSSSINGYVSGGNLGPSLVNTIEKFPFANDTNSTDLADVPGGRYAALTQSRQIGAGQSSTTNGYISGGYAPGAVNTIDKFFFSSSINATDVGDMTQARFGPAGQSSSTNGYISGGSPASTIIEKFPFASDSNAASVGNLTQGRRNATGQQV